MGIQRAISGSRIEDSSKDAFFELVAGLWPDDTSFSVWNSIPRILLQLDRERAIKYLLRPAGVPSIHGILQGRRKSCELRRFEFGRFIV